MLYYVYRYTDREQYVYVGKSKGRLKQRIKDHSIDPRFKSYANALIEYCELATESDMNITESLLIKLKHPIINIVDQTDADLPFVFDETKIVWKPYSEYKVKTEKPNNKKEEALQKQKRDVWILHKEELMNYIKTILDEQDPIGLYTILDKWQVIIHKPTQDVRNGLHVPKNVLNGPLTGRIMHRFAEMCSGTEYGARIHMDKKEVIFVLGKFPKEEMEQKKMIDLEIYNGYL